MHTYAGPCWSEEIAAEQSHSVDTDVEASLVGVELRSARTFVHVAPTMSAMEISMSISMGEAKRPWMTLLASHSLSLLIKFIQMTVPYGVSDVGGYPTDQNATHGDEVDGSLSVSEGQRLGDQSPPSEKQEH